jgi:hypothetical protein
VLPNGDKTKIVGNLVTGLLNLAASGPVSGGNPKTVEVWQEERMANSTTSSNPTGGAVPMSDIWTIELSGEINSEQPGSQGS